MWICKGLWKSLGAAGFTESKRICLVRIVEDNPIIPLLSFSSESLDLLDDQTLGKLMMTRRDTQIIAKSYDKMQSVLLKFDQDSMFQSACECVCRLVWMKTLQPTDLAKFSRFAFNERVWVLQSPSGKKLTRSRSQFPVSSCSSICRRCKWNGKRSQSGFSSF